MSKKECKRVPSYAIRHLIQSLKEKGRTCRKGAEQRIDREILICDPEEEYVRRLAEALLLKKEVTAGVRICSSPEMVQELLKIGLIKVLLISEDVPYEKRKQIFTGKRIILTRQHCVDLGEEETELRKYQPVDGLMTGILKGLQEEKFPGSCADNGNGRILGVYSPVHRIGKTTFSLKLGKALDSADKVKAWKEGLINNAIYLLIIIAVIYTYTQNSRFLSVASIVNIISLSAANIPIACGIAGTIVLTGTDLSAGRVVGLTACISASLLQSVTYATKIFPDLPVLPIPLVILIVIVVGGIVGWVNGFFVAKFHLHPFIVTLATQLIVYGILLMYIMLNGNNGQPLSGLDKSFKNFVTGSFLKIRGVPIPNYVWYACVVVVFMWFMWNKTTFGKNMFAVGSNPEAANVSGVNVMRTTILVHTLAGCMYGITGFIESARIGSNQANTGLNYECDAIAACVIGGVSFVGGTGKISGVVLGVFILRIIFVALQFLAVSQNMQYVIKGLIILIACAIDMRKYLVRK